MDGPSLGLVRIKFTYLNALQTAILFNQINPRLPRFYIDILKQKCGFKVLKLLQMHFLIIQAIQ